MTHRQFTVELTGVVPDSFEWHSFVALAKRGIPLQVTYKTPSKHTISFKYIFSNDLTMRMALASAITIVSDRISPASKDKKQSILDIAAYLYEHFGTNDNPTPPDFDTAYEEEMHRRTRVMEQEMELRNSLPPLRMIDKWV